MSTDTRIRPITTQVLDSHSISPGTELYLYGGAVPFGWSLEVYLQKEVHSEVSTWNISLHIIAQGAEQQVFRSEPTQIIPGQAKTVVFPQLAPVVGTVGSYGVSTCEVKSHNQGTHTPKSVSVVLHTPNGGLPHIEIVDTEIITTWLIGIRHIVLTDPPLLSNKPR